MSQKRICRVHGGFTLIEAVVATVIVGMGIGMALTAITTATQTNGAGKRLTQAVFLVQEIREWTLRLPFQDPETPDNPPGPDDSSPQVFVDDLDDLMNVTYDSPRDGMGDQIYGMVGWSETISITWRDPNNLTETVTAGTSEVVYVQVEIFNHGTPVLKTGWLVTERE